VEYSFEEMEESHREAVVDVYNYFIENTWAAYPDEAFGYEIFDYFLQVSIGYPAEVILDGSGEVVGFAFMSSFHPVQTFEKTAAISYFILPEHTRKGIGRALLDRFEDRSRAMGISIILAHVSSLNENSLMFHEANGFEECGRLRGVGTKFGKDFDVVWLQKSVSP